MKNRQLIFWALATLLICSWTITAQDISPAKTAQSAAATSNAVQSPPANDNFADAQFLGTTGSGSVSGTNNEATVETGEQPYLGVHSVWYKWSYSLNYSAGYTFTTRNAATNFDTTVAIYTGTSVNNLTFVAGSDDYGSTPTIRTSTAYFLTQPNTTYYIAVDGFNTASGNFNLSWDLNRTHADSSRFGGDGQSTISLFRPTNGTWYVTGSNGFHAIKFGQSGDVPAPADFDGDKFTDYAVFRPSNGTWYVLQSSGNTFRALNFGQSGDKPVPGDYTADGYADFAVFRPSNGTWYVLDSLTNAFNAVQFGANGDKSVPRDFDSDGKLDFTVYRPSTGTWYILSSRDGSYKSVQFGTSQDIPVPGGYIPTGLADIAVWRPSTGVWYVLYSYNNSVYSRQFGQSGDIPQPINYGSNVGESDLGIYRPSNGTWYILEPGDGNRLSTIDFGASGDIPTATAYPVQ